MRDAIQTSHVKTLQGAVSFDENGDIDNRVDQRVPDPARHDKYPVDDIIHQYNYIGVAPLRARERDRTLP